MPNNKSFLPQDYLEKRNARRTNIICLTLFLVVTGAIVATFFITGKQVREVQQLRMTVNDQFEDAARKLEKLEKLQAQKDQMLMKAEVTSVLVEKIPRSRLLAELTNFMPMSLSLTEFSLDTKMKRTQPAPRTSMERAKQKARKSARKKQQKIEKLPDTEVTIVVSGLAPTDVEVAQFLTSLNTHKLFKNTELQFSEETNIDGAKMRSFKINMELNQGTNIQHIQPRLVKRKLNNNPMDENLNIDQNGASSAKEQIVPVRNGFDNNSGRSR